MNNLFEELHNQASELSPELQKVYEAGMQLMQERDEFHADLEAALQREEKLGEQLKDREVECVNAKDYMVKQAAVINELVAHVEKLRSEIACNADHYIGPHWGYDAWAERALKETPAQSLNHITEQLGCSEQALNELKAEVEEETIRRCANTARMSYNVKTAVLNIEYQQRKYPKAGTEEGGE